MHGLHGNRRGAFAFLMLVLLTGVIVSPRIGAGGSAAWPFDHPADVSCGFGSTYQSPDGKSATHRGVDLLADAGEDVLAPLSGQVRFVGRVPASAGGTQLALTIARSDGMAVTLMPLEGACAREGDSVAAGTRVAALAGEGDASSGATHLHVGVRKGDLYVDPMTLLSPPAAAAPEIEAEPEVASVPAAPVAAAAPAPAPAVEPVAQVAPQLAPQPALQPAPAPSAAPEPVASPVVAADPADAPVWAPAPRPVIEAPMAMQPGAQASAFESGITLGSAQAAGPLFGPSLRFVPAATASTPLEVGRQTGAPVVAAGSGASFRWLRSADLGALQAAQQAQPSGATGVRLPSVQAANAAVRKLIRAWTISLLAALAAAAALWPLWRRRSSDCEEESWCGIAPEGSQVAAAAGR